MEVIAPRRRCLPHADTHRIVLPADEVAVEHGIPVTTPARTLLDLAQVPPPHRLEAAINEPEYLRLTSPTSLTALLTRHRGRTGTAALRTIAQRGRLGQTITGSELEALLLAFLDAHALPRPLTDEAIGPCPSTPCGPASASSSSSTAATRTTPATPSSADRALLTNGHRVARITYRQLRAEQPALAAQLRALTA